MSGADVRSSVLVTGASGGIGAAIARRLAQDKYDLALHCRSARAEAEVLAETLAARGIGVRVLQFDLADRDAVRAVLAADIEAHGAYYGVVCNAGVARDTAFPMMVDEDWDQVLRTNLDGLYHVWSAVVTPMIRARRPGRIVTMSSVSGVIGNRGQVNYSAAKAGIIGASKALAVELAKRKITVNCVAPGLIETAMTAATDLAEIIKAIPARRAGRAEEVAGTVAFLLSEEAAYITRQVICVNGGLF